MSRWKSPVSVSQPLTGSSEGGWAGHEGQEPLAQGNEGNLGCGVNTVRKNRKRAPQEAPLLCNASVKVKSQWTERKYPDR